MALACKVTHYGCLTDTRNDQGGLHAQGHMVMLVSGT
jgi:hypothetical protein